MHGQRNIKILFPCSLLPFLFSGFIILQKKAVIIGIYCFRHTSTVDHNKLQLMFTHTSCMICEQQQLCIFLPLATPTFSALFNSSFWTAPNFWKIKFSKFVASKMEYCQWIFLWGRSLYAATSMCLPFWGQNWTHMWVQPFMTACFVQSPW